MTPTISRFLLPLCLTILLAGFLGDKWQLLLRYQRDLIGNGELWRLLSGQLLHLGWNHLLMNLAGLILIVQIFSERPVSRWWQETLISALGVSFGLYFFNQELLWYVGLSGLLHGLLTAALLDNLPHQRKLSGILLAGLAGKLLWEQMAGPLPLSEQSIQGAIIVDAHLYGALSGALSSLFFALRGAALGEKVT